MIRHHIGIFVLLASSHIAFSQPELQPKDTLGWHLVKEGETLQSITTQYLGVSQLWRENWKLNPDLRDPHRIYPGQKIRVILHRELPAQTAQVTSVKRRVEHQLVPSPWESTQEGDLLRENDGLRTYAKASSELLFADGSTLTVGQDSLVFLQTLQKDLVGVSRESVEIVKGQADVKARPRRKDRSEIEIVMGGVQTRPRSDRQKEVASRHRLGDQGQAEVMVFSGTAQVESAGSQIDVPSGMGTVVRQGESPPPPSALLSAPKSNHPAPDAAFNYANPSFTWREVPAANSYRVEVFQLLDGQAVLTQNVEVAQTHWSAERLPPGQLEWRVVAVDHRGLDGFPSQTRQFTIHSDLPDLQPPQITIEAQGPAFWASDDKLEIDAQATITLFATDDVAGVANIEFSWNTDSWSSYTRSISPPIREENRLQVRATDHAGKTSKIHSWVVMVSTEGPPAPRLKRKL